MRFILHVYPVDPDDLPAHRTGFDILNFGFHPRQSVQGEGQLRRGTPAVPYAIARTHTGQISEDGGLVWEAGFNRETGEPMPINLLDVHRSRYLAIVSREPAVRSRFDVHLGANTLHFVKAPCGSDDTAPTFFLHLNPRHRE